MVSMVILDGYSMTVVLGGVNAWGGRMRWVTGTLPTEDSLVTLFCPALDPNSLIIRGHRRCSSDQQRAPSGNTCIHISQNCDRLKLKPMIKRMCFKKHTPLSFYYQFNSQLVVMIYLHAPSNKCTVLKIYKYIVWLRIKK